MTDLEKILEDTRIASICMFDVDGASIGTAIILVEAAGRTREQIASYLEANIDEISREATDEDCDACIITVSNSTLMQLVTQYQRIDDVEELLSRIDTSALEEE